MAGVALAARIGDSLLPDATEALGFLIIAQRDK
jgi:hypothetical protein